MRVLPLAHKSIKDQWLGKTSDEAIESSRKDALGREAACSVTRALYVATGLVIAVSLGCVSCGEVAREWSRSESWCANDLGAVVVTS